MIMQPETGKLPVREKIGHSPGDGLYLVFSGMFFFQSFVNIINCSTKWAGCFHFD